MEKNVTFFNAFNHFLINANLRILPDDFNALKCVKKATR
jgi:hypothetical protein